jgi:hypothetical protein
MNIDDVRGPSSFYPPFFSVHIPAALKGKITPQISPYTGGDEDENWRGIADINFPGADKLSDEEKNNKVILRVYITEKENNDGRDIQMLKGERWIPLKAVFIPRKFEIYAGYLQAQMRVDDPPIAVG